MGAADRSAGVLRANLSRPASVASAPSSAGSLNDLDPILPRQMPILRRPLAEPMPDPQVAPDQDHERDRRKDNQNPLDSAA